MDYIKRKLKFITDQLNMLEPYKGKTIQDIRKDYKELKFIEKVIQELVDCASDINEYIIKKMTGEKPFSTKRAFRDLQSILEKHKLPWEEEKLRLFIDSVSFRNEIVHSYDVNVYLVWSNRNISVIIQLYKEYTEKILLLLQKVNLV
ncbi:MAG: DUF86 domain-containing protein [Candidatus Brocadiales bacterium]|uniref:DUF86 domain-containing protein n=1 Tax=Candidatus Wunengus sp. YC60 TaxID=3367697 RepID=UPI0027138A09|nr:DUF86 domain-containing protein [Candidatus Brocadiales bacterium]